MATANRMCVNHLSRRAQHSCRVCSKPICDECSQQFGGRFCSPECADRFSSFQERVSDTAPIRRTRFSILGCLRTMVISAILLVVIWAALWQLFGTAEPGEMWAELKRMFRLAF